MAGNPIAEIIAGIRSGEVIPYLGAGTLAGVADSVGKSIPADSESLILALNNGQPLAPRLMYEFPRAAMHLENKRGRSFIERFLTETYSKNEWSTSALHRWIADLNAPYVIDINRDTQLQTLYADREHTLIVGASRISGTHYRFDIYVFKDGAYNKIEQCQLDPALPILFKPMGTPLPKPSYVASDADYVDYITELMGGFAIPTHVKKYREGKRYLLLGMRFTRDTERMVFGDMIYNADDNAGWAFIPEPNDKERRFLAKKHIQIVEADWPQLIGSSLGCAADKVA